MKKEQSLPNELDELLKNADQKQLEITKWLLENTEYEEKPVEIKEFILSKDYLDQSKNIRDRILLELEKAFSHKKGKTWLQAPKYNEFDFPAGIGSGKSYATSLIFSYLSYQLGCLKDPAAFFGFATDSKIYLMNMSVSGQHARNIIFGEIKARIDNSPWFRERLPYDKKIQSELRFPKGIRIIPGNSSESFFIGYNIFGGAIDEADSHVRVLEKGNTLKDFAQIGYDAIKGRVKSRFGDKGFVVVIGSPQTVDGFLMTRYNQGQKEARTYTTLVRTWESLPKGVKLSGETFKLKGIEIPIEYKEEFDRNPEKALRDLAAVPMYATQPFFLFPERIESGFNADRESPFIQNTNRLKKEFVADDNSPMWVHVDIGIKKDATGLAMGHIYDRVEYEGEMLPKIKMDLIMRMSVPKGSEIEVADIRQFIYNLIERGFHIIGVTFDGFQSIESIQQLTKRGIKAERLSVDKDTKAYDALKEAIYQKRLDYYYYKPFIDEAVRLELINGDKVDHPAEGSKDVSDAVAGVVYSLMMSRKARRGTPTFYKSTGVERIGSYELNKIEKDLRKINKTNKPLRRFYGV